MAYIHQKWCEECGEPFAEYTTNFLCGDCYEIKEKKELKKYMVDIREGKTLEQRIEQIEEWIYENRNKIHDSHITDLNY